MTRILIIEDEFGSVQSVRDAIGSQMPDATVELVEFETAEKTIRSFRPDIVLLDLARGNPSEQDYAGLTAYEFIWQTRFCPIVVYAADPDLLESDKHEFVKKVKKGSGSEHEVLDGIRGFLPHIEALQKTEDEIRQRLSEAMREIAPHAFKTFSDPVERQDAVVRAGRRRVAAMMDEPPAGGKLAPWECYLHPPVSGDTLLGDVLKDRDIDITEPNSFRVVLTPSCDMGREPKVRNVLVAKCCPMDEALKSIGLDPNSRVSTIRDQLLSAGYAQSVIALPPLPGMFPPMAADLRDLELVPIGCIGDDKRFQRKASLDSPFREMVAWAYMQTACRPGLPERELDTWAQAVKNAAQQPPSAQPAQQLHQHA